MTTTPDIGRCETSAPARLVEYQMTLQAHFPKNHPDAELIGLVDRFLRMRLLIADAAARLTANCERLDGIRLHHPEAAGNRAIDDRLAKEAGVVASEAEIDRLSADEDDLVKNIISAPARTIDGICLKAIVLEHVHELYCRGVGEEGYETQMIRSLAKTAMSFTGIPADLRQSIEAVMRTSAHPAGQMVAA